MSDVSGVANTGSQAAAAAAAAGASGSSADVGEQFNSFIQLLTAQVKNQDPLSPLDSTQFVNQLATFSSLEQQVNTNTNLQNIAGLVGGLHSSLIAGQWLGETVAIDTSWVPYTGDPVEYVTNIPESTDEAVLKVRDSSGNEIWSQTLDPEQKSYFWNGETEPDKELSDDGIYQLEIQMYKDGELVQTTSPRMITTVTGVSSDDDGTLLINTALNLTTDMANVHKYDRPDD